MTMRIWHQSVTSLDTLGAYGAALRSRIPGLVSPRTEVVLHGLPAACYAGRSPAEVLRYPYIRHKIHGLVLDQVRVAAAEGFDAVALVTFAEPLLEQARACVDMPVISMLETCLLTACTLARRMALVTLGEDNVARLRDQAEGHRLSERIAGILALTPPITEFQLMEAFARPGPVVDAFVATARGAVAAGAGVIIPAEGVLNEVLAAAEIRRIGDTPVMDCVAVVLAYTEMMVGLRRRVGLEVDRGWQHTRAPADLMAHWV